MKNIMMVIFQMIVTLYLFGCWSNSLSNVTIKNVTDKEIKSIKIKVCSKTKKIDNLAVGESISLSFNSSHDSSYELNIVFGIGEETKHEIGYVTNGFCYNDTLVVMSDTVEIISRPGDCN